jgi:hypothetical protein
LKPVAGVEGDGLEVGGDEVDFARLGHAVDSRVMVVVGRRRFGRSLPCLFVWSSFVGNVVISEFLYKRKKKKKQ